MLANAKEQNELIDAQKSLFTYEIWLYSANVVLGPMIHFALESRRSPEGGGIINRLHRHQCWEWDLSEEIKSSITVWSSLYMSTFIGSTCRNEWSSNSCRLCITSSQGWRVLDGMWPVENISARRHHVVVPRYSLGSYVRRAFILLLPVQRPGTHSAMICVIRLLALTSSDVWLKLLFSEY